MWTPHSPVEAGVDCAASPQHVGPPVHHSVQRLEGLRGAAAQHAGEPLDAVNGRLPGRTGQRKKPREGGIRAARRKRRSDDVGGR